MGNLSDRTTNNLRTEAEAAASRILGHSNGQTARLRLIG